MKIFLTGANGFLGSRLATTLNSKPYVCLTGTVRRSVQRSAMNRLEVRRLSANTDWSDIIKNQNVVIHTAARAHIMQEEASDPLKEYRRVNVEGTLKLAQQAADAGVARFIFVSSIKVNGESTTFGATYKADDLPAPENAYGISKYEAEKGLLKIAAETGLEVVIIRPPLVYGRGVKGNFSRVIRAVEKQFILPLGSINNKRSLVALDNLVDLIITCIDHPAAANQIFLAGDGQDLSTTELFRAVAKAGGISSRLVPVPASVLMFAAGLFGKKEVARRLLGSLQVDISKARDLLGWTPPLSVDEGLHRCFVKNAEG